MNLINTKQQDIVQNIGLLGGTFDPIHYGHIKPVIAAAQWLGLDEVKLMPAHIPPHKNNTFANAQQRLAMVELVCQQYSMLTYDARELKRNQPSFTVTTLKEIKKDQPNSRLFFFIGMDSLINFTTWHNYQEILHYCHLVVSTRPNYQLAQLDTIGKNFLAQHRVNSPEQAKAHAAGHILLAPDYFYPISSTQIRAQLQQQNYPSEHLPEVVLNYIIEQKLYNG